jgi:hypothetical protein
MSHGFILFVTSGVHTGATVMFGPVNKLTIGSAASADLMLVDERVKPAHVELSVAGKALTLAALHDGVKVFGRPMRRSTRVKLEVGSTFSVDTVEFLIGADGIRPKAAQTALARLGYLRRYAPFAWLGARWSGASWIVKSLAIAAPVTVAALAIGSGWLAGSVPIDPQPLSDAAFRLVKTHVEKHTGARIYEGYVETPADLATLTALAWRDSRPPVMRVTVLAQLRDQLDSLLARYYRGARASARAPGFFSVAVPRPESYLLPESWDYARVSRLARAELAGLQELTFPGHEQRPGEPVRMPVAMIGMNLVRSRHAIYLADARGGRFFAGARLPIGKLLRVSGCAADVMREDDGVVYQFFTQASNEKACR